MKFRFLWGPLGLVILWGLASWFKWVDPFLLPSPFTTILEFKFLFVQDLIYIDIISTFKRLLIAFFISVSLALPIGLFLGRRPRLYRKVEFLIDFFRSTPATALFPLFLIIFGVSDRSKIAVACFAATFIILFNVAYGVINSKKTRIHAAKLVGASEFQILTKIVLWDSLPQTLIGLRSAMTSSLIVIVVTEMFIGTDLGMGKKIIDYQITYELPRLYGAILIVGGMGYLINLFLYTLEKRLVHWSAPNQDFIEN